MRFQEVAIPSPPRAEPIRTARLDLLPLGVEHAGEMAAVLSDPALHTYIGGSPLSPTALRTRYERLVTGSPDPTVSWCNWVLRLRETSRLTGTIQATVTKARTQTQTQNTTEADSDSDSEALTAEIAWVVGTPWQGRGFASEAARGLVGWLRERGVDTVVAHIHPEHRASAAVATAAGLAPTQEEQDGEVRWRLRTSR